MPRVPYTHTAFATPIGSRTRYPEPEPVVLASGIVIREWVHGGESFSDWLQYMYDAHKGNLSYALLSKLEKTIKATTEHEEYLCSLAGDGSSPICVNPYLPYNGYTQAFADISVYISRLLPQEKNEPFIATITRAIANRTQTALEMAEEFQNTLPRWSE